MSNKENDLLYFTSLVNDYLAIIDKYKKKKLDLSLSRNLLIDKRTETIKEIESLQNKIVKLKKRVTSLDNQINSIYTNLEKDELTELENIITNKDNKYIFPLSYYIEEVLKELALKKEDVRINVKIDNSESLNSNLKIVVSIIVGKGKNRNRIALAWDTSLTASLKDGSLLLDNISIVSDNQNSNTYLEYTGNIDNLMVECTLLDLFSYRMIRNKNNHDLIKKSLFKAIEKSLKEELLDSSSKKLIK